MDGGWCNYCEQSKGQDELTCLKKGFEHSMGMSQLLLKL